MLQTKLETKSAKFSVVDPCAEVSVNADLRALRQVLINVIGNAVKFSPPGSLVTCSWEAAGGCVRISVIDQGPGMSSDVLEQLGNPFVQSRDLLVSNNDGVGLGLAISMELVKAMGGQIIFENLPLGGLRVLIELPIASDV